MYSKLVLTNLLAATLLSACSTVKPPESAIAGSVVSKNSTEQRQSAVADSAVSKNSAEQKQLDGLPNAELVASLPKSVESFELQGAQAFDEAGDGVNVRYSNDRKQRRADVFVYPVAEKNRALKHSDLVMGSTQATMRAISQAVQQGIYHNLNVIDAATKANGLRTVARVQATYLRKNLASYTLVYQTEHDGTMVKIRMTMPDNEPNRESREWDRFADKVLEAVTTKLDEKNAAVPAHSVSAALETL